MERLTEETEPVQIPVPNTVRPKGSVVIKHVMDFLNIGKEDEFFMQI